MPGDKGDRVRSKLLRIGVTFPELEVVALVPLRRRPVRSPFRMAGDEFGEALVGHFVSVDPKAAESDLMLRGFTLERTRKTDSVAYSQIVDL